MWPLKTPSPTVSASLADAQDQEEKKRLGRIRSAWNAYGNALPDPLEKNTLDPKGDDNTKIGFSRKIVNLSAFFLFGSGVDFEVDGDQKGDIDDWLTACWEAQGDGLIPFLLEIATSGGIEGDVFLRLYPARPGEPYPRVVALSAENVRAIAEPSDYADVCRFVIQWTGYDAGARKPVAYRHTIERAESGKWKILEQRSIGDSAAWITDLKEDWPYSFCPIFHAKNLPWPHCYYGASDLEEDVLHLQKAINFNVSNVNRILRAHGHPFDYVSGQKIDEMDRSVGTMLYLPNPEARINRLDEVDDLSAHGEQFRRLKEALHDLTSVPEVATGRVQDLGQLSGLALQILYAPLSQMISTKQKLYGAMLKRLCAALLEVGGKGEGHVVTLKWPSIVPVNVKEQAESGLLLRQLGVSQKTVLSELGYDQANESQNLDDESATSAERAAKALDRGGVGGGGTSGAPTGALDDVDGLSNSCRLLSSNRRSKT
jgi:hypothetical protein